MEKPIPMDRVICSLMALRPSKSLAVQAAFKVGTVKQVAVLVPTTLLADQHLPDVRRANVRIPGDHQGSVIAVHRRRRVPRRGVDGLADGSVGIVIGTHRLQTGALKDLGLVVVDEEQRFGVEHKEHIKSLRTQCRRADHERHPDPRIWR